MKKHYLLLTLSLFSFSCFSQSGKILIVSTNRDSVGNHASGTFLKEMAYPFQLFIDQGYEVDIVTPRGDKAAVYHWGKTPDDLLKIWKSDAFITKTSTTLSPAEIDPKQYVAIFYPGGHGQYFDVVNDERIATLAAEIYEAKGIVATAGHGAASLINVQLSNGKYLVANKRITCFPHWAELAFMNISDYGKLLAFDMEEVLKRRGADLVVCSRENRSNLAYTHVVDEDNRMVTGAFADSAPWVAEQTLRLLRAKQK